MLTKSFVVVDRHESKRGDQVSGYITLGPAPATPPADGIPRPRNQGEIHLHDLGASELADFPVGAIVTLTATVTQ